MKKGVFIFLVLVVSFVFGGDINKASKSSDSKKYPDVNITKSMTKSSINMIDQNCKTGALPFDCRVGEILKKHILLCMKENSKRSCYIVKKIILLKDQSEKFGPMYTVEYGYFVNHLNEIK